MGDYDLGSRSIELSSIQGPYMLVRLVKELAMPLLDLLNGLNLCQKIKVEFGDSF